MNKLIPVFVFLAVILGPSCGLFALTDEVATITYIEKLADPKKPKEQSVGILRNAAQIAESDIDFGTSLQNFDTIRTGAKSTMEITINAKTGIDAVLTVLPSTTLTLDITALKTSQKGAINLLAGTIDLKVKKMTGSNELAVRTATANMGVRGTTFEVSYSVSGDILLSTQEGRVECTVEDGKVLFSAPGDVVQGTYEGEWSSIPVAVEKIAAFRQKWRAQRIEAFRANPIRATRQFALLYTRFKARFNTAYAELMTNRDLIIRWINEDNAGNIGNLADRNRDKLKLIVSLAKLRRVSVHFERAYYRLNQIDELYGEKIPPQQLIRPGVTVAQFFQTFHDDKEGLAQKLADIQFIGKLYAKRNDGSFPLDDAGTSDMKTEDDAFGAGQATDGTDTFFDNP